MLYLLLLMVKIMFLDLLCVQISKNTKVNAGGPG